MFFMNYNVHKYTRKQRIINLYPCLNLNLFNKNIRKKLLFLGFSLNGII